MTVRLRNNVQIHGPAGGSGDGLTAPTSGEEGYVAIAGDEDLTYLPGTSDGDVLTWVDATSEWVAARPGEGDVHGPVSSVDNQVVRFDGDGSTGTTIQGGTNAPTYDDSGNLSINAGTSLRLWNAAGTFYVGLVAPTLTASETWVLPLSDGTAGQALVTDGDGNLSFASVGAGSGVTDHGALTGLTDVSDHPGYLLTSGTRTASYIKFGTYPATVGQVRLPHEGTIVARNYANGADVQLVRLSGTTNYLLIGSSYVSSTDAYATLAHAWHLGSYKLELLSTGLNLYIGSSVASLPAAGYQTFFRYHDTLCVATETGRNTVAPMDVT
jgi:hypothetical protein